MASAPPLGEVAVDVRAPLDKLLKDFADGKRASESFDAALRRGLGTSVRQLELQTNSLGAAESRLSRSFDQTRFATDRYSQSVKKAADDTRRAEAQINSSSNSIRSVLMASAGTIAAAFGAREIVQLADSYVNFTNRLRSAGIEGDALAQKQQQLLEVANRYGVALGDLGNLYSRIVQSQGELGASSTEVMRTVEGAAAAVRLFGASTAEQQGAIRQFSQMLGNPTIQMQEVNSLLDGARPLLQAAANGIDRFGGSVSKLVTELRQGGFQTKEFFEGLQRGLPGIINDSQRLPLTLGASFQVLNNQLGAYIGQTNESWSATQRMGAAIRFLGDNLNVIMPILTAIVLAIGARYVAAMGKAAIATLRQIALEAAAAVAKNVLAVSANRVTTTLGVTTIATEVYSGSLGIVTLEANAATAGLTRMQVVMATGMTVARGAGAALLAAFGGWVGVAIMGVVGAVLLFNRAAAAAKQEIEDFNTHQTNAVRLLREEAQWGRTAAGETRQLGQAHQTATGYVRAFAGATGDAADALHRQAMEARNARVELLKTAAQQARADQQAAYQTYLSTRTPERGVGMQGQILIGPRRQENIDAENRMNQSRQMAERLEAAAAAAEQRPLESYISPNARTQGRDLPTEIAERRAQLLVAERNHNEALQRQLLQEIRLRERIVALIATGLNFENASAQANAEALGRAPAARGDASTTLSFMRPVPGAVLSPFGVARPNGHYADGRPMPNHSHAGVDIRGNVGDPVMAPQAGFARRRVNPNGLGNYVEIDHGGGTRTRLAHLSAFEIPPEGMFVERGQVVGRVGTSGNARGGTPHLHYERREHGRNVNPLNATGEGDPASLDDEAERAQDERAQHDAQAQRDLQQLEGEILQATQGQQVSAEEIERLERQRIGIERDRQKVEIEAKHTANDYTDAQAEALLAANERLRVLQLHNVDLQHQQRLEQEATRVREQTHETEMTVLQSEQEAARTATQRRAVERRILAAQKEYERLVLQATIDSPFSSPLDKQVATASMASLDRRYGAQAGSIDRQTREDLLGTAPEGSETAHRQQMQAIRDQETERLSIVEEWKNRELELAQNNADRRNEIEAEAARRRVEIEKDAQNQLREGQIATDVMRLQSAQATADSLQQIATQLFGEHSRAARAMFIVSKGFAIAESVLQLQVALAKALALGFPQNIPAIASVAAIGASIISNIVAIGGQFDTGGWTGYGSTSSPAGTVHGQEFVVRAGPARQHRSMLEDINSGRDPTSRLRAAGGMGAGGMKLTIKNLAPGVEHEARQIGPGEIEVIAKKVVARDAPGVVAADMGKPNSRTSKALRRSTAAPRNR